MSAAWVASCCIASAVLFAGTAARHGRDRGCCDGRQLAGPVGGGRSQRSVRRSAQPGVDASPGPGPGPVFAGRPGPDRSGVRRAGVALGAAAVLLTILVAGPGWAAVVLPALVGGRAIAIGRARARRQEALDAVLPELIDLLTVAAAAGHPVRSCVEAVAPRAPAPVRPALDEVGRHLARGRSLQDSLRTATAQLGPMGPALVEALVSAHQSGAPLAPVLGRLAATSRDHRRRRAEERSRRLPVALLFPLVCCILPAFALLAVVPLLAASLGSLSP